MNEKIIDDNPFRGHWVARTFTLIELLVVIAIIAILASMLFPALKKAREMGNRIACASNQRQIGMACMNYVQTFEGYYPYSYYTPEDKTWAVFLTDTNCISTPAAYARNSAFVCPTYEKTSQYWKFISNTYTSYTYSRHLGLGNGNTYRPKRCVEITHPSSKSFLIDGISRATVAPIYYAVTFGDLRIAATAPSLLSRHSGGSNLLFFDNHVNWSKDLEIFNNRVEIWNIPE